MRAAKAQASLRMRAVSPEPLLLANTNSESRGTFRQKARSLAPLNGWACAVKICHDGMLEDTKWLDGAHLSGAVTLLGGAGGMVLGGVLIRRFKFGVVGMARLCVLMSLLAIVVGGGFFISCPDIDFAGVTKRYGTK